MFFEQSVINTANAIIRTHDEAVVIAGHRRENTKPVDFFGQAAALKADGQGKLLWSYAVGRTDKAAFDFEGYNIMPEFNSAAAMADDSVYLCGGMPSAAGEAGLLTHLDKDGKLLSERHLVPEGFSEARIHSCTASGRGIVVAGAAWSQLRPPAKINDPASYDPSKNGKLRANPGRVWVAYIDENGKMLWSKTEDKPRLGGGGDVALRLGPLLAAKDGGLIFTQPGFGKTAMMHLKPDGTLTYNALPQRLFETYLPIIATDGSKQVELITEVGITRVTLDDNFKETARMMSKPQERILRKVWDNEFEFRMDSGWRSAYRLPDQSLVLFGSMIGVAKGGTAPNLQNAGIMVLDPSLQHQEVTDISEENSIWIDAVAPWIKPGEFIVAREGVKQRHSFKEPAAQDPYLGMALDFVEIK